MIWTSPALTIICKPFKILSVSNLSDLSPAAVFANAPSQLSGPPAKVLLRQTCASQTKLYIVSMIMNVSPAKSTTNVYA